MFDTIHNDVVREIDNCVHTEQFQKRVSVAYDMCPDTGMKAAIDRMNSDLYVSPLTWKEAGSEKPSTGTEIENGPLSAALQDKVDFKREEWEDFRVVSVDGEPVNPEGRVFRNDFAADLSSDSYIKDGDRYFKPDIKLYKDLFIDSIKGESAARAEVYKAKPSEWFASNANLGKAVMDGLALSTLVKDHYDYWLRDTWQTWCYYDTDDICAPTGQSYVHLYHDYQRSYRKLLAMQWKELTESEAALKVEDSDEDTAKRLQALALEECVSRRWITKVEDLEHPDETTSFTSLMTHLTLGDLKVAERQIQDLTSPDDVPEKDKEGKTPLVWACKENDADATLLLLKYNANTEIIDKVMYPQICFYVNVYS